MKNRSGLFTLWVIFVLAAGPLLSAQAADIQKCTAKAGKSRKSEPFRGLTGFIARDSISFSGLLNAAAGDLDNADEIVVTIDSEYMSQPLPFAFPINGSTFKKGKYSYTSPKVKGDKNAPKTSFKFDPRKDKCTFAVKNVDLTGLSCPMTVEIQIGDYVSEVELDEDIVNGNKPIPIQFMMGVVDILVVDEIKPKFGKTASGDSFSIKGGFATASPVDILSPLRVTLGSNSWTIPGMKFISPNLFCKRTKAYQGGYVTAKFDFSKCIFKITISKIFIEDHGKVSFDVAGSFLGPLVSLEKIDLGPKRAYGLEELRLYDLPKDWEYQSTYAVKGTAGSYKDVKPATVSTGSASGYYWSTYTAPGEWESLSWYTGAAGRIYVSAWDGRNDIFDFEFDTNLQVAPPLLRLGQLFQKEGTFTGSLEVYVEDAEVDISHLHGTIKSTCKLIRHEKVTTPKGTFNAVRVEQTCVLNGAMSVYVFDYYKGDLYANGKVLIKIKDIWWGVPGIGIVKAKTSMSMKVIAKGAISESIKITNTDVLTGRDN